MPIWISFLLFPIQAYKSPWRLFTTAKCKISSRRSCFKVREDKMAQSHPQIWPDSPPSSTMMVLSSDDVTACPLKTQKVSQCLVCSFWASVETLWCNQQQTHKLACKQASTNFLQPKNRLVSVSYSQMHT